MVNPAYKLLKSLKVCEAAMNSSRASFMPPEPLPNSVKAKQLEEQEMLAEAPEGSTGVDPAQLQDMQKAQQDAVGQVQQQQQEIQQLKGELQGHQQQAQSEVQQAKMQAMHQLQEEKMKSQQKLLSMQEHYTKALSKEAPGQSHILATQLKRLTKKVNGLGKMGAVIDIQVELLSSKQATVQQEPVAPSSVKSPVDAGARAAKLQANKQKIRQSLNEFQSTQPSALQNAWSGLVDYAKDPVKAHRDSPAEIITPWDAKDHNLISTGLHNAAGGLVNGVVNSFANMGSNLMGGVNEGLSAGGAAIKGLSTGAANIGSKVKGYGAQVTAGSGAERDKAWNTMNSEIATRGPNTAWSDAKGHLATGARNVGAYGAEAGSWAIGGAAGRSLMKPLGGFLGKFMPSWAAKTTGVVAPSLALGTAANSLSGAPAPATADPAADPEVAAVDTEQGAQGQPLQPDSYGNMMPSSAYAQAGQGGVGVPMTPSQHFTMQNTLYNNMSKWGSLTPPIGPQLAPGGDYEKSHRVKANPMTILNQTGGMKPHEWANPGIATQRQQGYGSVGDFIKQLLFSRFPGMSPSPDFNRFQRSMVAPKTYMSPYAASQ